MSWAIVVRMPYVKASKPALRMALQFQLCDSCANYICQLFKTCKKLWIMRVGLTICGWCLDAAPSHPAWMESITPLVWMEPVSFSDAQSHLSSLSGWCLFPWLPSAHGFAHGAHGPAHGTRMKGAYACTCQKKSPSFRQESKAPPPCADCPSM